MDTLHRLAGVRDVSGAPHADQDEAPQPVMEPADGFDADDYTSAERLSQRASRASLPLNRQSSRRSLGRSRDSPDDAEPVPPVPPHPLTPSYASSRFSNPQTQQPGPQQHGAVRRSHDSRNTHDDNATEDEGDFVWGPTHPCFPHPNPHCLPDSDEARATRVIRVRRDWLAAGDQYPQFANLYPEILDPLVTDEDFRAVVSGLNGILKTAFDPLTARAWTDALLGVATGYLWDDLGLTGAKSGVKRADGFVQKWNDDKARQGQDVRLMPLRRTGFMALDFVIPDPGLDGGEPSGRGDSTLVAEP